MGLQKTRGGDESLPLVANDYSDELVERTGTVWSASAHIITAVIGSGVLALAWGMAQLGWIAGPATILLFAAITVVQSSLLADLYKSPDSKHGYIRNHSYMDVVRHNLDEKSLWICGVLQQVSLYGVGVAYTITSSSSVRIVNVTSVGPREESNFK